MDIMADVNDDDDGNDGNDGYTIVEYYNHQLSGYTISSILNTRTHVDFH